MKESDLTLTRRDFLLSTAKAAGIVTAGLIVGPAVLEWLDRSGPRRLLVPGYNSGLSSTPPLAGLWEIQIAPVGSGYGIVGEAASPDLYMTLETRYLHDGSPVTKQEFHNALSAMTARQQRGAFQFTKLASPQYGFRDSVSEVRFGT